MIVRHLRSGETLPDGLETGFNGALDPEWTWLAEDSRGIEAVLLAGSFHGLVILGRLVSLRGAPRSAVRALLRTAFREMSEMGYEKFISWVNAEKKSEARVARLAKRGGGVIVEASHKMIGGRLDMFERATQGEPEMPQAIEALSRTQGNPQIMHLLLQHLLTNPQLAALLQRMGHQATAGSPNAEGSFGRPFDSPFGGTSGSPILEKLAELTKVGQTPHALLNPMFRSMR